MAAAIVLMKCTVCGYTGQMKSMGTQLGFEELQSVELYLCPNCGADHTYKEKDDPTKSKR